MKRKSSTVELDLAETIPEETLVKLAFVCRERKLPFPDGIVLLLAEASKPKAGERNPMSPRKRTTRKGKTSSCKGKVR